MRSVISALVIFIIIITMIVISCIYTDNVVDKMLQSLYKNENHVAKKQWNKALVEGEKTKSFWYKNRKVIVTLFDHRIIEKIDECMARMNNAVKMQKKEDFYYEFSNLGLLLKSLTEQQKINIGNVF